MSQKKPVLAITMGDPSGIGPEICLEFLQHNCMHDMCVPVVVGDACVLEHVGSQLNRPITVPVVDADSFDAASLYEPAILDLKAVTLDDIQCGRVSAAAGQASYDYIIWAIEAAMRGDVDGVVTGPIHKEALHAAGLKYPGHTEIFTEKTNAERSCMMLTSEEITCGFVTTHVGYKDVPGLLTVERILNTIELMHDAMQRIRGREPKLMICGLNPHAGENGLFGEREEERIVEPAVEAAQSKGIDIIGPFPPDTVFLPPRRKEMDAFVCLYHDQGHIVLKALAFDQAVNITLGLPIIRTSVDHGTAFDIAWQGKADVSSLLQATHLAAKLAS